MSNDITRAKYMAGEISRGKKNMKNNSMQPLSDDERYSISQKLHNWQYKGHKETVLGHSE